MNHNITTPQWFADATHRISAARAILLAVKNHQSKDGEPDISPDVKEHYGNYINILINAGFILRAEIPEGGFPYRITWKGLCFLDTAELSDQIKQHHSPDSAPGLLARFALFSFH